MAMNCFDFLIAFLAHLLPFIYLLFPIWKGVRFFLVFFFLLLQVATGFTDWSNPIVVGVSCCYVQPFRYFVVFLTNPTSTNSGSHVFEFACLLRTFCVDCCFSRHLRDVPLLMRATNKKALRQFVRAVVLGKKSQKPFDRRTRLVQP